jgi:4-hydroxybenzoate polyprenyltransferase
MIIYNIMNITHIIGWIGLITTAYVFFGLISDFTITTIFFVAAFLAAFSIYLINL